MKLFFFPARMNGTGVQKTKTMEPVKIEEIVRDKK